MTPATIDELRKLLAEATPGPWRFDTYGASAVILAGGRSLSAVASLECTWPDGDEDKARLTVRADAGIICAAVNALPSLLDSLDASRKRVEALEGALSKCADVLDRVQWAGWARDEADVCPAPNCTGERDVKPHDTDCLLAVALATARGMAKGQ